ncbi:MAG: DUF559 domain-containing protein [Eubacteriaceae bacterium]|jgi:hypothetical protein|nr:DUF559 domain-containing protein [Eubacteriaceae bacterium]
MDVSKEKWGYLRETKELAERAGRDADTGLHRTGLEEYLAVIFPGTTDWIHDKTISNLPEGIKSRKRPDYRSESLKMIVEFDGTPHYDSPQKIRDDEMATEFYESLGYKVVRIPFFIQLTNKVVKQLFGVDVEEPLFNESIPSMGPKGINPASICGAGIMRMAKEFRKFPEQYAVNLEYLKAANDEYLTGAELLETMYNKEK